MIYLFLIILGYSQKALFSSPNEKSPLLSQEKNFGATTHQEAGFSFKTTNPGDNSPMESDKIALGFQESCQFFEFKVFIVLMRKILRELREVYEKNLSNFQLHLNASIVQEKKDQEASSQGQTGCSEVEIDEDEATFRERFDHVLSQWNGVLESLESLGDLESLKNNLSYVQIVEKMKVLFLKAHNEAQKLIDELQKEDTIF